MDSNQFIAVLTAFEGNKTAVYGDGKGIPTIGIGLNLTDSNNMALFLNQISIGGVSLFAQAASGTNPQTPTAVVAAFEALLVTLPANAATSNPAAISLQTALNNQILSYYQQGTNFPVTGRGIGVISR